MRAGLLREIIDFKELVETKSPSGAARKEYVKKFTCKAYRKKFAYVKDADGLSAREEFNANTLVFQVRYHPSINENQRVCYNGSDYKIMLLDPQLDRTYILTCQKVNA